MVKQLTVNKLAAILQKAIDAGQGRLPVSVIRDTLDTGNDTFNVCGVFKGEVEIIEIVDGDGFHIENKDGTQRQRREFVLRGEWWDEVQ